MNDTKTMTPAGALARLTASSGKTARRPASESTLSAAPDATALGGMRRTARKVATRLDVKLCEWLLSEGIDRATRIAATATPERANRSDREAPVPLPFRVWTSQTPQDLAQSKAPAQAAT